MDREEWIMLAYLCHKALEQIPPERQEHEIASAVRLTGAFAASTLTHMEPDPDLEQNKRDEDMAPEHP